MVRQGGIDYLAKLLDEDAKLLQAIVRMMTTLATQASSASMSGPDEATTRSHRNDIENELDRLGLPHAWRMDDVPDSFVDDEKLIARIKKEISAVVGRLRTPAYC
ncbi:hypothetical protein EV130_11546 [Rhizobium azibense]|uniref:Uncharacterized protein n=1 Tax=Rhizobium azibense TaxID=1136135 RepID=A0A4R3QAE5_9HYPH|nr:hypothetical protein [Rhizobium azibense]TCU17849.1 hypothetical protein EV130_11546 [Rhizobium azibense]